MLERFKSMGSKIAKGLGALALLGALIYALSCPRYETVYPRKPADFKRISAFIVTGTGSGSGTVLSSNSSGSEILTNAHVCVGAKIKGSYVYVDHKRHTVASIRPSLTSDLCLMHTNDNLMLGVAVAPAAPQFGDHITTAGFPLHMPLLIQQGFVSEVFAISENIFFKESVLLTSVLVQPGHSGSGVFDDEGKLIGTLKAFKTAYPASNNKESMGFGLCVPHLQLKMFVDGEAAAISPIQVPDASRS